MAVVLLLAGCQPDPEADRQMQTGASASAAAAAPRYSREYIFLSTREEQPMVVPFAFLAHPVPDGLEREARAWLAHGSTWNAFLDEEWRTAPSSDVWQALPHGALRLAANGPSELEALWFQQGDRRLRLDLGAPASEWIPWSESRFRLLRGLLTLGEERVRGTVLETLQLSRPDRNGDRAPSDLLFLASGDSLRVVLSHVAASTSRPQSTFGWTAGPLGEQSWEVVETAWVELRPLQEARRDIPLRWRFSIPAGDLTGEVWALGYDVKLGDQQAGRHAIEVRYTVTGWIERAGQRDSLTGMVRHTQG